MPDPLDNIQSKKAMASTFNTGLVVIQLANLIDNFFCPSYDSLSQGHAQRKTMFQIAHPHALGCVTHALRSFLDRNIFQ